MPIQQIAVARHAMATRFEIVLEGEDPIQLRAAGEEALDEIERIEGRLSLYQPTSDVAHINARAAASALRIESGLFRLLQHAGRLHHDSAGTFDVTIAPLIRCWGFMGGSGALPEAAAIAEARSRVGMEKLLLNETERTLRFATAGMMLDFGAIGKGYALDRAAELLRDAGVTRALLHGGTSTVYALGRPSESDSWNVAIECPDTTQGSGRDALIAVAHLKDEALSVSAVWGKSFQAGDRHYGHVLDPRTGEPADGALLAAVLLPSATETDALSTALLVLGCGGNEKLAITRPELRSLVVTEGKDRMRRVESRGIALQPHWETMRAQHDG